MRNVLYYKLYTLLDKFGTTSDQSFDNLPDKF